MLFYPSEAKIPKEFRTEEFILRPLRATDVELDYDAVVTSRDMLRVWGQGDWPSDNFSLQDNLEDLEWHEKEHLEGKAFTFTVMNLTETKCLGCVYINPLLEILKHMKASDATMGTVGNYESCVNFWVRQSLLADGLESHLLESLITWFKQDWKFSGIFFMVNTQDIRQVNLFETADLKRVYTLDLPDSEVKQLIYQ
ncbi:MAG: hypothetical protein B6242_03575 [Anaerolineaceae bacterium 4572_78]|nr:MAG: hypothetical protein B6242_03575 [Anaerolineaceae bacterium 4572_78]